MSAFPFFGEVGSLVEGFVSKVDIVGDRRKKIVGMQDNWHVIYVRSYVQYPDRWHEDHMKYISSTLLPQRLNVSSNVVITSSGVSNDGIYIDVLTMFWQ